jgi:hypothetical protein
MNHTQSQRPLAKILNKINHYVQLEVSRFETQKSKVLSTNFKPYDQKPMDDNLLKGCSTINH